MDSSFSRQRNPNMEKALFNWAIVLQYGVKAKDPLISRKFSGMKFFYTNVRLTYQTPPVFVSVQYNQSNRSISVRLLFLFCSRIFISRLYENRSTYQWMVTYARLRAQAFEQLEAISNHCNV